MCVEVVSMLWKVLCPETREKVGRALVQSQSQHEGFGHASEGEERSRSFGSAFRSMRPPAMTRLIR